MDDFRNLIWNYYHTHGRRMPWRTISDPYKIYVSEIMLQQTQVPRVMEKYPTFIKHFPTFKALADASQRDVLLEWIGLGYNRRGVFLKKSAEIIINKFKGKLPQDEKDLLTLPGIGPATAGSLQAFVFNKPIVFIETNIRSVYIHHFFKNKEDIADSQLLPLIEKTLDRENPREWYYALMDYGAYLKKNMGNSSKRSKHYTKQSTFKGSNREVRGRILKTLLSKPLTFKTLEKHIPDIRLRQNLENLEREGLLAKNKTQYYVPN